MKRRILHFLGLVLVLGGVVAACDRSGSEAVESATAPAVKLGAEVQAPKLTFNLPADWDRGEPSSQMRVAQASIPGEGGAGELAVFHFGAGQGGGVDANIARWIAQMEMPEGAVPKRDTFAVGPYKVTWVDVSGTLKASQMGMGPKTDQSNYRLFGAVIEGPGGPWFFKATGPDKTMAAQRDAFLAMLHSARPNG
jgi:hypothetical protein